MNERLRAIFAWIEALPDKEQDRMLDIVEDLIGQEVKALKREELREPLRNEVEPG